MSYKVRVGEVDTIPDLDPCHADTGGQTWTELLVDPERRLVEVTQQYDNNSTSSDRWHKIVLASRVDRPDADALKDFLESSDIQAMLALICAGHATDWDGNNWVGTLTREAERVWGKLIEEVDELASYYPCEWGLWAIDEWAGQYADEQVTAASTDEELAALEREIESMAKAVKAVLAGSLLDYLLDLRAYKKEAEEE